MKALLRNRKLPFPHPLTKLMLPFIGKAQDTTYARRLNTLGVESPGDFFAGS